jgi:hypothetical protein
VNHVIPWSRTTKTNVGWANGRRISYVNDIRFRNLITAIIHRAIYLFEMSFSPTNNMKQEALTVRVTKHLFLQRRNRKVFSLSGPDTEKNRLKDHETNHEKTNKIFDSSYNLNSAFDWCLRRKRSKKHRPKKREKNQL